MSAESDHLHRIESYGLKVVTRWAREILNLCLVFAIDTKKKTKTIKENNSLGYYEQITEVFFSNHNGGKYDDKLLCYE